MASGSSPTASSSAWLDAARLVATFAVVILHTSSSVVSSSDTGSSAWWAANVYDSGTRWCVPVFVMISGALLLDERRRVGLATFYRRRSARIVAPLVFWAGIFTLWKAHLAHSDGHDFSWRVALIDVASGKPYYHLWFLYMLLCLYLVTPLIQVLVRGLSRGKLLGLVIALFALSAAAQLLGFTERAETIWFLWFLPFLSYFVCGHLVMTTAGEGGRLTAGAVFVLAAVATAIAYFLAARAHGVRENIVIHDYLGVTVIPMALAVMWLLKGVRIPREKAGQLETLAGLTLGVYVMHPVYVDLIRLHWPLASRLPLVSVPVVAFLIFACTLALTALVKRVPVLRAVV
jgi:surface polysaccharide O-acyltransferase-like enzyme